MRHGPSPYVLHGQPQKTKPRIRASEIAVYFAIAVTAFAIFKTATGPERPTPAQACVLYGGTYTELGSGLFGPAWECEHPPGVVPAEDR